MARRRRWRDRGGRSAAALWLAAWLLAAMALGACGQTFPGTTDGRLFDSQGHPLPGVTYNGFSDRVWLNDGVWQWQSEDPLAWSLRSREPGSSYLRMTITANTNLLGPGNVTQNVLLLAAPIASGVDFTAETRVFFRPTKNYETACLLIYQDDDHYLALARAFCDPSQASCRGDALYFDRDQPDRFFGFPNFATAVPAFAATADVPVWLRVTRVRANYSAYYSLNGTSWIAVGTHTNVRLTDVRIGLTCLSGGLGSLGAAADFDYIALATP